MSRVRKASISITPVSAPKDKQSTSTDSGEHSFYKSDADDSLFAGIHTPVCAAGPGMSLSPTETDRKSPNSDVLEPSPTGACSLETSQFTITQALVCIGDSINEPDKSMHTAPENQSFSGSSSLQKDSEHEDEEDDDSRDVLLLPDDVPDFQSEATQESADPDSLPFIAYTKRKSCKNSPAQEQNHPRNSLSNQMSENTARNDELDTDSYQNVKERENIGNDYQENSEDNPEQNFPENNKPGDEMDEANFDLGFFLDDLDEDDIIPPSPPTTQPFSSSSRPNSALSKLQSSSVIAKHSPKIQGTSKFCDNLNDGNPVEVCDVDFGDDDDFDFDTEISSRRSSSSYKAKNSPSIVKQSPSIKNANKLGDNNQNKQIEGDLDTKGHALDDGNFDLELDMNSDTHDDDSSDGSESPSMLAKPLKKSPMIASNKTKLSPFGTSGGRKQVAVVSPVSSHAQLCVTPHQQKMTGRNEKVGTSSSSGRGSPGFTVTTPGLYKFNM